MKLEVNNNHKKADIKLSTRLKPILTTILGVTLSVSLLSGCYSHVDDNGFYIGTDYASVSSTSMNKHFYIGTLDDLDNFKASLEANPDISVITINNKLNDIEFNEENYGFLRNYNIKVLELDNIHVNPTFLESLGSIELLKLKSFSTYYANVDYSRIDNLKRIEFYYMGVYDYPVFLTNQMINDLRMNNVDIYLDKVDIDDVISLNNGIDDIVKNDLNINENSSDIDKLNEILLYILENFEYDEVVANNNANNIDDTKLVSSFYAKGIMDALYNKKGNIICGNYSALFQALANRVGLTSYYVTSSTHAWNLVCFNGERYYVDSTWLDTGSVSVKGGNFQINRFENSEDAIRNGNGPSLEWYLENIYNVHDDSHKIDFLPSNNFEYIEYLPNEEDIEEKEDMGNYLYEIIVSGERYIADASTILGILITLGIARKVIKKANKKEEKHRKYR